MRLISEKYFSKPIVSFQLIADRLHIEVETERLLIRSYDSHDFENCACLYGDSIITKFFDHGKPRTTSELVELIRDKGNKYFNQGKPFGLFSIFYKNTMSFVGQIDLLPTDETGVLEIGFILHEKYHNQGICTEAMKAIIFSLIEEINLRFDLKELPVVKILATVHPMNQPSIKVLKKLGMNLDKIQERFGNPRLWYSLPLTIKQQKIGS